MRSSRSLDRIDVAFDDVRLVVRCGSAEGQRNASQKQKAQVFRTHLRILTHVALPPTTSEEIWGTWHTEKYRRQNTKTLDCCN